MNVCEGPLNSHLVENKKVFKATVRYRIYGNLNHKQNKHINHNASGNSRIELQHKKIFAAKQVTGVL